MQGLQRGHGLVSEDLRGAGEGRLAESLLWQEPTLVPLRSGTRLAA